MNKKKLLLILLLVLPLFVNAKTYFNASEAPNVAQKFIVDFPHFRWYVDTETKYLFNGTTFSNASNSTFQRGGFINESEFNISKHNGKSYLINGRYYWTMTPSGSYYKYVENDKLKTPSNASFSTGTRVVEYVKGSAVVSGKGTYANPWTFEEPEFYVDITFDSPKIYRENVVQTDGIVEYGDIVEFVVKVTNNGPYPAYVNAREVELGKEIDKTITLSGAGNTNTQLNNANALMSSSGLSFDIGSGQTIEYVFRAKVIGNAGDVIDNLILYSVDGVETKEDEKNKTPIEKRVSYVEVKDSGVNVVLVLDDSGSMGSTSNGVTRFQAMKNAAEEFINSLVVGDTANFNNKMCLVSMNYTIYNSKRYVCQGDDDTVTPEKLLDILDAMYIESKGTPYNTALMNGETAIKLLGSRYTQNQNSLVFLSDGSPSNSTNYQSYVKNIKNYNNTHIYSIGYNTGSVTSATNVRLQKISSNYDVNEIEVTSGYFYPASNADISNIFRNISSKINEEHKRTESGVFQISGEIDRSRKIAIEVIKANGSVQKIEKSFAQAVNESYLISSGTKYEINIKMFEPDDKITVTYFLKNE